MAERMVYAARQLLSQVDGEVIGEPDGRGVYRSVAIPAEHADAVLTDRRVAGVSVVGELALVDFVQGRLADEQGWFDLSPDVD